MKNEVFDILRKKRLSMPFFKKVIFFTAVLMLLTACSNSQPVPVEKQGFYMGTFISEKVYGENAEKAAGEVMDKMKQIESSMTINAPGGEVNNLNMQSGNQKVNLSEETLYVLGKAKHFSTLSEGAFNVTVGPLVKAWGIFTQNPRVPEKGEISRLLSLVDDKDLTINEQEHWAKLSKKGQVVDLGGIAKGYAGDAAINIYKKYNIKSAYINLGGNVVVLGSKPDGTPWKVGIQNPRAQNGVYMAVLSVKDKAVVSSGDYERYFEKDGIRYHHIIDPKTGYPADSDLIGTTIVADLSIDADALSTATFVLGLEKGMRLAQSIEGVEAVFITKDKKVYATKGLEENLKMDDESKEFEYVKKR
ncbi:MAG: FAD:protein FMN transferase [Clostridia bacterium]|nr:FAD:protein FMN transferase [Clostridia bacterium]